MRTNFSRPTQRFMAVFLSLLAYSGTRAGLETSAGAFVIKLPNLIASAVELGGIEKGLTPVQQAVENAFSEENLKKFSNTLEAYQKKDWDNLKLTELGIFLNTSISEILAAILATYPFARLGINQVAYPIAQLVYDGASVINLEFAKNMAGDIKGPVESGIIDRLFALLDRLDNLLTSGLLDRISKLFEELDVLIPKVMEMKIVELS